jgi:hypothetical protein
MKRRYSFITAAVVLAACILFLWMFFAASTLERTADLGGISAAPGQDARALAYEFAARWRHGMAGNSPLYMPGFFASAIAFWFWCRGRSLARMLGEGAVLITVASVCAALLAPLAAPRILADFVAQKGVIVSHASSSGTWVTFAQGVYSLLTWSTVIIAARWSIGLRSLKLRSLKPLLIPLALNLVLALVRPWTVADFTSLWMQQTLDGETVALRSFLLVPILAAFMAWAELRSPRSRGAQGVQRRPSVPGAS